MSKKNKNELLSRNDHSYILKLIADSINGHFYVKDKKNRFVMVNKAKASFYKKKPDNFIGKTDFDLFPEEKAKKYSKNDNIVKKSGKPITDKVEKVIKSGKEIWISNDISPWYDRNGNIIGTIGMSRDITNRKNFEDSTLAREKSFFTALMNNLPDSIYFKDKESKFVLINKALAEKFRLKKTEEAIGKKDFDFFEKEYAKPRYEGEQYVIKTGNPLVEQEKKEVFKGKPERWVSSIKVPWYDGNNNIIGILGMTRDITDRKKAEDKMYENKISEGKSIHESLVESLKENFKKGDHRNETRIKKIEEYAILIGKNLNLSRVNLEELKLLLNLHNIGKMALADEIMLKKRRLTKEDWKIIKEIPLIGYRIAESSPKIKPIAESILSHHEWYDGSGYPRGIKGEEIPILSRISSLINAYEAMTSDRPYRKRMTKKEAIEEIKRCSGTQFDPKVTEFFIKILEGEEE